MKLNIENKITINWVIWTIIGTISTVIVFLLLTLIPLLHKYIKLDETLIL